MQLFIISASSPWIHVMLFMLPILNVSCGDIDSDALKNDWIPKFKQDLEVFAEEVLRADEIKQAMDNNFKDNIVKLLDENQEFNRIHQIISQRITEVHTALRKFKVAMETEVSGTKTPQSDAPLPLCCSGNSPGDYVGRLRQKADLSGICIGSRGSQPFNVEVMDSFDVFKMNYQNVSAVLWQYFSTVDGHFVQYPKSKKQCNDKGRLISPLTERWFVDKLFMKPKNIVIVFDVGDSTNVQAESSVPMTLNYWIQTAVKQTLQTLTPNDRVNVIAFNNTAFVPNGCPRRLFIANQENLDTIRSFVSSFNQPTGGSDMQNALDIAYNLFLVEKRIDTFRYAEMANILIMITPGNLTNLHTDELLSSVASYQHQLDKTIKHFVHMIRPSYLGPLQQKLQDFQIVLKDVALQYNPNWPLATNLTNISTPVGPDGHFSLVRNVSGFVNEVATYYNFVTPMETVDTTIIAPIRDKHSGLIMTSTVPVYNRSNTGVYGVAAIDVSMATIFAEVLNFDLGVHSYMFLLEKGHGHVLLHPKLTDPAENLYEDPIFPPLEAVEPTMTQEQCNKLISATAGPGQKFNAKVRPGRNTFMSGVENNLVDATVLYQNIIHTQFVVVLVWFPSDRDLQVPKDFSKDMTLHAPYHRLDQLHMSPTHNKPADNEVCSYGNSYIAPSESVIKLAPSVFKEPEKYKYSKETPQQVIDLNRFLEHSKGTTLIRPEIEDEIIHFLRSTNNIDVLWRDSAKDVLERFLGTPTGVLRVFPGIPMDNSFNHMHYKWFKKSCGLPDQLVFSSGRFTHFSHKDVMLMSKAISENLRLNNSQLLVKQLQAVVAATLTHRQITAILFNKVPPCAGGDVECHIVDSSGYMFTHGDGVNGTYSKHITQKFPWLANHLIKKTLMKPVWCTSMSEGSHRLSYTLTLTFDKDDSKKDPCRTYAIGAVDKTNLFVLVLLNRNKYKCQESSSLYKECTNSNRSVFDTVQCSHCVHRSDPLHCESPCVCTADFDQCSSRYADLGSAWFPDRACYSHKWRPSQVHLKPLPAPSSLKACLVPCVSRETKAECEELQHCTWKLDLLATCVWRNDSGTQTLSESSLPTIKLPSQPTNQNQTDLMSTTNFVNSHSPNRDTSTLSQFLSTFEYNIKYSIGPVSSERVTMFEPTKQQTSSDSKTAGPSGDTSSKFVTPVQPIAKSSKPSSEETFSSIINVITTVPSSGQTSAPVPQSISANLIPSASSSSHIKTKQQSRTTDNGRSYGWVAGVVVAVLLIIVVLGFLIWIFYKRFRKARTTGSSSKYLPTTNVFDGALFRSGTDQAVLTTSFAAASATTPYQQLN